MKPFNCSQQRCTVCEMAAYRAATFASMQQHALHGYKLGWVALVYKR